MNDFNSESASGVNSGTRSDHTDIIDSYDNVEETAEPPKISGVSEVTARDLHPVSRARRPWLLGPGRLFVSGLL
jgi:hypothetical protein